jgi:regulator of protease activity HflC (stomatin/prohibitin superfamily)
MPGSYAAPPVGIPLAAKKYITIGVIVFLALVAILVFTSNTFMTVHAYEIVVKQNAVDGQLQMWIDPGLHNKLFGTATAYRKSSEYSFSAAPDQGSKNDQSIKARFNDGGHANISGTLRWEIPLDVQKLTALHTKFGSYAAVEQQLIRPVVERAVYMTGPLMSSKESAAERRSDLIQFIEDQVVHGVYKTDTEEVRIKDPLSGQERTVTRVRLIKDANAPGGFARQEDSPLTQFGIKVYSFNINGIAYDDAVEKQIQAQQDLVMQVQTAIASAKKAEQDAITAQKQGEAAAAKAKWEQEVIKAQQVTQAQQKVDVAKLAVSEATLYKQQQTLIGEGDAARRKAAIVADGALETKLRVYESVMVAFAHEIGKQQWVPTVVMGSDAGKNGGQQAVQLLEVLGAKAAKDLALDTTIQGQKK